MVAGVQRTAKAVQLPNQRRDGIEMVVDVVAGGHRLQDVRIVREGDFDGVEVEARPVGVGLRPHHDGVLAEVVGQTLGSAGVCPKARFVDLEGWHGAIHGFDDISAANIARQRFLQAKAKLVFNADSLEVAQAKDVAGAVDALFQEVAERTKARPHAVSGAARGEAHFPTADLSVAQIGQLAAQALVEFGSGGFGHQACSSIFTDCFSA